MWLRRKGELLRPDAFSPADVDRIKRNTVNPDFEALYQQYHGEQSSLCLSRHHFGSFSVPPLNAACVISVDPGHRPGAGHSFTVLQAWCSAGDEFFLLDQWRAQSDVDTASRALRIGCVNCRAEAVLIEELGYGPILARELRRRFPSLDIRLISTDRRSKSERLLRHFDVIKGGRIKLPRDAHFREPWDDEIEHFPHGKFNDQVDTMTQGLDYMRENPKPGKAQTRCMGVRVTNRGVSMFADPASRFGLRAAYTGLGGRRRMTRIFPRESD